jgi:hypothetical protein
MNHSDGFKSLNAVLNKYPGSYQQGDDPVIVIWDSEQYVIRVSLYGHPYSEAHRLLALELVFSPFPFFALNSARKRALKRLNKNEEASKDFSISASQNQSGLNCLISKVYTKEIDLDELEQDRLYISMLAMLVFRVLSDA